MRQLSLACTAIAVAVSAPVCMADLYRYTGQLTASGSLGGQPFSNAPITITLVGNTANIVATGNLSTLRDVSGAASIQIGGVGTVLTTNPAFSVFSNTGFLGAGFSVPGENPLVRTPVGTISYTLGALAPTPFTAVFIANGNPVATTSGTLLFSSASSPFVFSAELVPTPGTAALLGIGGLLTTRRRRA